MTRNITRADLAKAVFQDLGLSFSESEKLVDEVFEQIVQAFERGESVKISSFASFYLKKKNERIGRNPKTGQEYAITPRSVLSFVASQGLKDAVIKAQPSEKKE